MNNEYYVLLGDVVKSYKINDKTQFEEKLIKTCLNLNKIYNESIHTEIKLFRGINELGGVLYEFDHIYEIVDRINKDIRPHKIRIVLVKGPIDSGINSGDFSRMSGSGIHKASVLMRFLKSEKALFRILTGDKILDNLITNNINLILLIKGQRTDRQLEILEEYDKLENQELTGEKFGILHQTVSVHLRKAHWSLIKNAENRLKEAIDIYSKNLKKDK
jgi:hypothetical protein